MERPSPKPGILSIALLAATSVAAWAQIPAFPGAEGYGAYATGGRGGDVYYVTNLNGSGQGSFAQAITTVPAAGRTVVFAVSGYVTIPSSLQTTASKLTIAGQTAPGDGFGLRGGALRVSGDDVVVRHLRIRRGRNASAGGDCLNMDSGSIRSVFDHVSLQFSTDENFSSFSSPPEHMTFQWSINAWGLEPHSMGGLWDQNHATCHHTLWAHNHSRDPKARPNGLLEWINNVTFDYGIGFIMGDSATPANWKANVLNSYFIAPPGNIRAYILSRANLDRNGNPNFSVHVSNCRFDRDGDFILDGTDQGYSVVTGNYTQLAAPAPNTGSLPVTLDDPTVAYKKLVSAAGSLRLDVSYPGPLRDEVDAVLMNDLVTQTARHISDEAELGVSGGGMGTLNSAAAPVDTDKDGMPDSYETALGWNPAAQDHNTVVTGATYFPSGTAAGYTRLEEYLYYKTVPHGVVARNTIADPTSIAVDMAKFTSGFSSAPAFTVSNVSGGSVALSGVGNSIATFTPTLNYAGRARFDFTVTDSAGHSWTQTCALLVTTTAQPRDLTWKGAGSVWDGAALNWLRPATGATVAFSTGDRVAFGPAGLTQPTVNITGGNVAGSVDVDASGSYNFSGAGALASSGALTKRGTGTLTLSNTGPNQFAGVTLEAGTLAIASTAALGVTPVTLLGGTLSIGANAPTASALTITGPATITGGSGSGGTGIGAVSGSAPLTILQTNVFDLRGSMSGYSGTITFAGSSLVRFNGAVGSSAATFDLGTGAASLAKRSGVTAPIPLGALAGGAGTLLQGAVGNTSTTHYEIGANGSSTTFSGAIVNGAGTTSITKTGAGTLTLAGTSTYAGTTAVNLGTLRVDGALGATAVTVAGGATLSGSGTIGGVVTANAGAILDPTATLAVGAGLSLNAATLRFDLANTPAGASDRIALSGGTLAIGGVQEFLFTLTGGSLAAGAYDLITGAASSTTSGASFTHNLPAGTRQTFALASSATKLWLDVAGSPATLTWTGSASAVWDAVAANWTGASPGVFFPLDAVVFDDTSTVNGITIASTAAPRLVTFSNATRAYTLDGGDPAVAAIVGGALVKTGAGALTLTGTNAPESTFVGAGATITFANDHANRGALGMGPITLAGGTLAMHSDDDFSTTGSDDHTLHLVVPAGQSGTLRADARCNLRGTLTGAGTLNFYVPWIRTGLFADWSEFTGTIAVQSDADGGELRIATNYTPPGFPSATVALSAQTWLLHTGILSGGAGTTIEIGALSGPSTSHLRGGVTPARALTYRIGGKGTDATFSGDFAEQNADTTTALVKTGGGIWTLAGPCTHRGATTVEAGTLRLLSTASIANTAPVTVEAGATLSVQGASITADEVTIEPGANFTIAGGTLSGDLHNSGTTTITGGTFTINGDVVNTGTLRVTGLATLGASGAFANEGVLDLLTSASALPANFANNGVVILNTDRRILTAVKSGANFVCTAQGYAGHTFQLQRANTLAGSWSNVGGAQAGTGSVLTFTDIGGVTGAARFYRLLVAP